MGNATEAITVRGLEAGTKKKLRLRAAEHGHSMEEEVRTILRQAVADEAGPPAEEDLGASIRRRGAQYGGIELARSPPEPGGGPPAGAGARPSGLQRAGVRSQVIVLDTNVLSELMKPEASAVVLSWIAGQGTERIVYVGHHIGRDHVRA